MATPRTGNPRGRKPKVYREDPDRYAIAFALALQVANKMSEASAFNLAAALFYGHEVEPEHTRRRKPPSTEAVGWIPVKKPGAVGLPNKATALRLKSSRALREEDAEHQKTLTVACALALGEKDSQKAILVLLEMLNTIAERDFGEKVLVPMILAKPINPI
jgi:hypothetical protein